MEKILNIILIEDNENDAELVIRQLDKLGIRGRIHHIESADELRKALSENSWDIVISDYSLPQFDAPAALRIVRDFSPDLPFIVVSGTIGEETAVQMMKSGAQDYLMKDKLLRLGPAIIRELEEARMKKEKSLALQSLAESEARFRAVFENSNDAIGVSRSGIHVFANPAYVKLYGYGNAEELINMPVIALIAESERDRITDYIRRREQDTSLPFEYSTVGLRKDGTEFDMDIKISIFEIQGVAHTLVIIRDVTLRNQEKMELIKAKEKAVEADRLKSTLMMNLSHEIRTPMNAILGFSYLMCSEISDPVINQMATRVKDSGTRLMKTLDDIMELTQLQSGIIPTGLEMTDLVFELEQLVDKYKTAAQAKNLEFVYESRISERIMVDGEFIRKAVGEVIDNAVKFTNKGRVGVTLSNAMLDGRSYIQIEVSDTGIGIEKDHHQLIFESFRQVSSGYGRSHEGSGLGLTIARQILEHMGGTITLESSLGQGSTFYIRIPGNVVTADEAQPQAALEELVPEQPAGETGTERDRPSILLVEDNDDNILVTTRFCRNFYDVTPARNGNQAVELARGRVFDLILMDINLGTGMDGLDTATVIRTIKGYRDIPIVAMTGYTLDADKKRFLAGGCTHYLGKPFSKQSLLDLLSELVKSTAGS